MELQIKKKWGITKPIKGANNRLIDLINTAYQKSGKQVAVLIDEYDALYIIFTLLTAFVVDVEVHTPKGRVDMVLQTKTDLYLVELKLNKSPQAAMNQINLRQYHKRFALSGLPITKVGINFDSTTGNIEDWVIE